MSTVAAMTSEEFRAMIVKRSAEYGKLPGEIQWRKQSKGWYAGTVGKIRVIVHARRAPQALGIASGRVVNLYAATVSDSGATRAIVHYASGRWIVRPNPRAISGAIVAAVAKRFA